MNCLEDKGPAASTMGRKVDRTLPNGYGSPFLYEVAMDEAKFQRNEKRVSVSWAQNALTVLLTVFYLFARILVHFDMFCWLCATYRVRGVLFFFSRLEFDPAMPNEKI